MSCILSVHKVREKRNGPHNTPYAQRLDLFWVIVGKVCLGGTHRQTKVNVYRTHVLQNGRTSFLMPCTGSIHVKEEFSIPTQQLLLNPTDGIITFPNTSAVSSKQRPSSEAAYQLVAHASEEGRNVRTIHRPHEANVGETSSRSSPTSATW